LVEATSCTKEATSCTKNENPSKKDVGYPGSPLDEQNAKKTKYLEIAK